MTLINKSKRCTLNSEFVFAYNYAFINHLIHGDQYGPVSTQFTSGTVFNSDILDDNGYVNVSGLLTSAKRVGLGFRVPDSSNFAGPYVLAWDGDAEVQITAGTWTVDAGSSSGYSEVSGGRWTGTNPRIVMSYTGARALYSFNTLQTDRSANGQYGKNFRFYRLADEPDFLAGNVYRLPFKQMLAGLNPSAIRYLDWIQPNNSHLMRFEHRTPPGYFCFSGSTNWVASLPYGETTGTNQYVLAGVTGTPTSMQHGEIATCRLGSSAARVGAGPNTVTSISKANPGAVNAVAHGFSTGDKIVHIVSAGMTQLDSVPCTITVTDVDNYTLGIDTSAFTTFTAGTAEQYLTLQVGTGNDRVAYPIIFGSGNRASHFGTGFMTAADYKTFYFDKHMVAGTDVNGAWIFNGSGAVNGHDGGVPIELCVKLHIELAVLMSSPPDLWLCIPHRGLLSMDANYTTASNFAIGAASVVLNGANGYSGLPSQCSVLLELSNEWWNQAFNQALYLARRGFLRYGGSTTDFSSFGTLRAVVMIEDVKTAFPANSRLKFVMSGQGALGVSGTNAIRITGNTNFDADVLNVWHDDPADHYDYFAFAHYFVASSAFDTANLTTLAAQYAAATTDADRETACAAYVVGVVGTGSGETITRYGDTLLPAYASALSAKGKRVKPYEGGWDHQVTTGTTDVNTFLVGVKRSTAWANALVGFYERFLLVDAADGPSMLSIVDQRWGHIFPDAYFNSPGVEWGGLDEAFRRIALYNNGRKRFNVVF